MCKKSTDKIPAGLYCYNDNGVCPYWSKDKSKPHQENGHCSYLEIGDWEADWSCLLWDQVKECGVNTDYDETDEEEVDVLTLYRPVGPQELDLIKKDDYSSFPPRLPEQPIFYPVTNIDYATKIASDWNVRDSGSGFVTKFKIKKEFINKYDIHQAGSSIHTEYWIPAEELKEFNNNIVGKIKVVKEFYEKKIKMKVLDNHNKKAEQ